jgi:S-layer protein
VGTGGSVAAGDGTDTIIMTDALAAGADGSATFNSKFTGFEVLQISDAFVEDALDVEGINGVSKVILAAGVSGTAAINNIASGGTVQINADGAATPALTVGVRSALVGGADTFTIKLQGADVDAGSVTVANVETITIDTSDPATAAAADAGTITLVATSATSLVVSGNNGVNITNTGNAAITNFNASGVVANNTATTTDTAAELAVTFVSANVTTTAAVSITGGAGNDALTGAAAIDTITGGEGADVITGGAGNDTIVLTETTAAADTVVFADVATNGVDTITGFAAGTGADLARLVSGSTTNAAQASAGIADFATSTNTTLTNGAAAFALTGGNTGTDDIIEITATLSSYGNLGLAGATSGTELLKALSSTDSAATSLTATTADDDFYVVAYQNGNAYLYQVVNDNNTAVVASEISLVGVFNGVAAGAFAAGDFTV